MPDMGDAMRRAGMNVPRGNPGGRGGGRVADSQKKCSQCGKVFVPAQPYYRTCPTCFRKGGGPRGAPGRISPAPELPSGYLDGGYFDESGNCRRELVCESAEELGQRLVRARLTPGQIRRFFGHVRQVEYQIKSGRDFREVEVEFAKLGSAAADAFSKSGGGPGKKIPSLFHEFIRTNVDAVRSATDFLKGFLPHFEAVLGFFNYYDKAGRGGRR